MFFDNCCSSVAASSRAGLYEYLEECSSIGRAFAIRDVSQGQRVVAEWANARNKKARTRRASCCFTSIEDVMKQVLGGTQSFELDF